jgi:predicted AlkP superfamily pyrophosphatase or phosphodiesterase
MKRTLSVLALGALTLAFALSAPTVKAETNNPGSKKVRHVLLISIDGMHAVDFYNCAHGIAGVNGGEPYCPNMAALSPTAINYVNVTSSRPSDSFPGMSALMTGGTP